MSQTGQMDMLDLGRRAVAVQRHWRWMPGVACSLTDGGPRGLELDGWRTLRPHRWREATWVCEAEHQPLNFGHPVDRLIPDLSDPAARGCLLSLVRIAVQGATGQIASVVAPRAGETAWTVEVDGHPYAVGDSEAEALVAALEAAP